MNDGIRIFNTEPLVEKLYLSKRLILCAHSHSLSLSLNIFKIEKLRQIKDKDTDKVGSVAIAEMLDRTNLIAIVSGGNYPIITPNSVLIWDDDAKEFALEYTFKSKVFAVKMSHKK